MCAVPDGPVNRWGFVVRFKAGDYHPLSMSQEQEGSRVRKFAVMTAVLGWLVAAGAGSASEPAPPAAQTPPPANGTPCLFARQISGWSQLDDQTVVLRSGSRKFKVTFVGPCRQAKWAYAARVDNFGVCVRPGDVMIFSSPFGHPVGEHWPHWGQRWPANGFDQRCMVQSVSQLPPGWTPPPKTTPIP